MGIDQWLAIHLYGKIAQTFARAEDACASRSSVDRVACRSRRSSSICVRVASGGPAHRSQPGRLQRAAPATDPMIRTLTGIAGLDLSSVREILAAIDDDEVTLRPRTRCWTAPSTSTVGDPGPGRRGLRTHGGGRVRRGLGWSREASASGGEVLAQVLAGLRSLGCEADAPFFPPTPAPPSSSSSRSSTWSPTTAGPRRARRSCAASCSGSPCPPCAAWHMSTTPRGDSH